MNSPTPLGVAERVGKNCGSRASGFEEDFTGHGIAVCLSHARRRGDSSPEERLFQRTNGDGKRAREIGTGL
ncbi:hypothetical protein QLX08_008552 [Tetragonisca angustula]|uniref:Uncharacterized protein n=1 Tax=Tetragonisca angustula TaxID=166442 RepID=A0AAW0ZL79_9HYME